MDTKTERQDKSQLEVTYCFITSPQKNFYWDTVFIRRENCFQERTKPTHNLFITTQSKSIMSKGLVPFTANKKKIVVFGQEGLQFACGSQTNPSFLRGLEASTLKQTQSAAHTSLRCGIYIMHKDGNATERPENRRACRRHLKCSSNWDLVRWLLTCWNVTSNCNSGPIVTCAWSNTGPPLMREFPEPSGKLPPLLLLSSKIRDLSAGWLLSRATVCETGCSF